MQVHAKSLQKPLRHELTPTVVPSLAQQHLWYRVTAAQKWGSLVLVPSEADTSALEMAQGMGYVAAREADAQVLVVNASLQGCRPERHHSPSLEAMMNDFTSGERLSSNCDFIDFSKLHVDDAERALTLAPQLLDYLASEGKIYNAAIFAVDSPRHETRSIPLVRSVDRALICIKLGLTTFVAARQLIDIVGREKVVGAVTLT